MSKSFLGIARLSTCAVVLVFSALVVRHASAQAAVASPDATPFHSASAKRPLELGVLVQSGVGLTEDRNSFKFLMAGVHGGKVLTGN
ncbi:MAG: hypothetical protein ABI072_07825, partial [Edaphobacter sp.]